MEETSCNWELQGPPCFSIYRVSSPGLQNREAGDGLEAPSMELVKLKSEAKPAVPAALPTPPGSR